MNCPTCGGGLNQRSTFRLISAGLLFVVLACGTAWWGGLMLFAAAVLALIGGYLLVWGIYAKGLWCRQCKKFPSP